MIRHSKLLRAGGVGLALLAVASCASSTSPIEIGFKRIALDLAFKDEELAVDPPPPKVITRIVEIDAPQVEVTPPAGPRDPRVISIVRTEPPPPVDPCPTAPENLAPERAAFAVIKDPPTEGVYRRHNTGKIEVEIATNVTEIEVPPASSWEIHDVHEVEATSPEATGDPGQVGPHPDEATGEAEQGPVIEFSITRRLSSTSSTTDTFRYTNDHQALSQLDSYPEGAETAARGDYLYLVKRVRVYQGEESVFTPSPPIRYVRLNVPEGDEVDSGVSHGGVDPTTNVSMTVQSQITGRDLIDVCGEIVDTYRVEIQENIADLDVDAENPTPETSGNEDGAVNVWNIQFDNGLLIVQETVDYTWRTTVEEPLTGARVPAEIRYQYTSTLDSLTPEPLPEQPNA